ncbi:MAG: hypothetical protein IJS00_06665 [Paludibacteraceae bacterium]|nr:hypothetical protein [Paludibacteraceae bacterium]
MKKQQTPHGALRARTRATFCAMFCFMLLSVSPLWAIDYSLDEDYNYAFDATSGCNTIEAFERVPALDNGTTAFCWKVIFSNGKDLNTNGGMRVKLLFYSPSATELPTGDNIVHASYVVSDTKEPLTLLKSNGIAIGKTAATAEFDTEDFDGSYIVHNVSGTRRVFFIRSGCTNPNRLDYIDFASVKAQNKIGTYLSTANKLLYNSNSQSVSIEQMGVLPEHTLTMAVMPTEAAAAGCSATHNLASNPTLYGTRCTISASAGSGWVFAQWRNIMNEGRNPYTIAYVYSDTTYTAFFVPAGTPTHKVYQVVNNDTYGRINGANPVKIDYGSPNDNLYEGVLCTLAARSRSNGIFVKWSNGSHTLATNVIVGTSDATYTAYFVAPDATERTITINTIGNGTAVGDGGYYDGVPAFLTATPDDGATFDHWENGSGENVSTDNPYQFTVSGDATYTAVFSGGAPATPTYDVAATVSPVEAGTVTGTDTFDEGDDVILTAIPANRRYVFSHWTDGGSSAGTDGVATYTINDIAADHNDVVAVFTEVPVTLADNEETAYYTATASTFTGSMDFQMMRTFYAGMWNTVCFPFDLTASQITASDMRTATFYTLSSVTGDAAEGLDFNVSEVTSLSARTPYLVQVSGANIVNPVFEDVTLAANAFTNNTSGTNVGDTRFFGTVHPTALETGENSGFLFLGQNNALYWPNVANKIRAFRAYFYSGSSVVQSVHPRARIVVRGETPTDVESVDAGKDDRAPSAHKYLQNGSLIIERDGKRYNAVGQEIR